MGLRRNITTPRTRERGELVQTYVWEWAPHPPSDYLTAPSKFENGKTYYRMPGTAHVECAFYQNMVDVCNLPQNWYNPVWHEKYKGANAETSPTIVDNATTGNSYLATKYSALNILREQFPVPPSWLIDDYAVKAELLFVKATDAQGSLINFIIELIEALEGCGKIVFRLQKIWEAMRAAFEAAFKRFRASGKSEAASYWLAWNFAVKPTIQDIKNTILGLKAAIKRLEFLRRRNHKPTTMSFRRRDFWSPPEHLRLDGPILPGIDQLEYQGSDLCHRVRTHRIVLELLSYKVDLVIKGKVRFDIDDAYLEGGVGLGIVWSAMQGLYNPEKILWEAAPFSWLADYFVSARQKLLHELFDLSPLKDATILASGHSFKFKTRWKVIQVIDRDFLYNMTKSEYIYDTTHETPLYDCDYDIYKREPGFPVGEENPLRIPGWYQLSNLLALLLQRWK